MILTSICYNAIIKLSCELSEPVKTLRKFDVNGLKK